MLMPYVLCRLIVACPYTIVPEVDAPISELLQYVQAHDVEAANVCDTPGHGQKKAEIARFLNSNQPVSKLPNELLHEILREYIHEMVSRDSDRISSGPHKSNSPDARRNMWWLILTRVCRRWRTLTLQSPRLWTKVNPSLSWHPEMLSRFFTNSSPLPLDLCMTWRGGREGARYPPNFEETLRMVLRNAHRIGSLSWLIPSFKANTYINELTDGAFSHLHCLHVADVQPLTRNVMDVMSIFLLKTPPNLRIVRLKNVRIDWRLMAAFPPTITVFGLEIFSGLLDRNYANCVISGRTLEDVLNVLENMPHLEELRLSEVLPRKLGKTRQVPLPSLKDLSISDSRRGTGLALFQCLLLPSIGLLHEVSMTNEEALHQPQDCRFYVSASDKIRPVMRPATIVNMSFIADRFEAERRMVCEHVPSPCPCPGSFVDRLSFSMWEDEDSLSDSDSDSDLISNETRKVSAWHNFVDPASIVSLSSITRLELRIGSCHDVSLSLMALKILKRAEMLEELKVDGLCIIHRALGNTDRGVLMPRLRVLKLKGMYVVAQETPASRFPLEMRVNTEVLCRSLEERKSMGHILSCLMVPAPENPEDISKEMGERLSASVGDFHIMDDEYESDEYWDSDELSRLRIHDDL